MTEEVKPEVIKKTQDTLGKYFKKPPLTEKLLKKPPFKFLHDIVTTVMRETGFFEGVFNTVEIKSENIKDKEAKIAFLQKFIGAVESATGAKLTVRPNKIVAGHEPTKTNELLQALAKALEKQLENGNGVQSNNQGKPKAKTSSQKKVKEETTNKKKTTTTTSKKPTKPIENGDVAPQEVKSKPEKSRKQQVHRDDAQETVVEERTGTKPRRSKKQIPDEVNEPPIHREEVEPSILENGDIDRDDVGLERNNHVNGDIEIESHAVTDVLGQNGEGDGAVETEGYRRPQSARPGQRKPSARHPLDRNINSALRNGHIESNAEIVHNEKNETVRKGKESNKVSQVPQSALQRKDANSNDGAIVTRPRTSIRPTTARPASARPAAPRIRDRGDVVVQEEVIRPVTGKVNVIVENDLNSDQDEENLVSLEMMNELIIDEEPVTMLQSEPNTNKEHGHLVEQILETQKELEDKGRLPSSKTSKVEIEWETGRSRESTNREVDRLRTCIQTLTRSANPLGKLLDFVQEDVDTMQLELEKWKEMNASLNNQLSQEQSLTEQSTEPLKIHLKELQQNIEQQREQIGVIKANIMRNDQKISQLLVGN